MKTLLITLLISTLATWGYGQYPHPGGMHPQAQLEFVKKKVKAREQPYLNAYRQLIQYADSAFQHPTHALADFRVPGYYIDAVGHRTNSRSLQSDAFDAYACALTFQLSGQKKYADQALRFLKAWADLNTSYSERDGSLVMAYSGTAMVMAGELLSDYKGWKAADRDQFRTWVRDVYRKSTNEIRTKKNNWADWGRYGSILSAYFLDDTAEVNENIRLMKSDLFDKIAEDGHMPHETVRGNNGIWYTYFSLAPITAAGWVAYNATGENLFTYSQGSRSIKRAVDYLYQYTLHPEEWPWFKNPNRGSPQKWPGNLLEVLGDVYNDPRYTDYVREARPLIYNLHHFAWTFPTLMKVQLTEYK
ncbi:alginate lyase family protein [Telluribacter sp. SYSU D00476]|uniref:alginate lyase family protein n=1 Tax=Telluribacter sp. SYSU D00476 TaxID=2811430 RepID=UPI001FF18674|nr:alginate lyase family protein [Telluribacter sp. SYSU D00476]